MQLSTDNIIILLEILTFVIAILVLYNLVFAAVSLRRVLKRIDTVTKQVEQVILKPISIADTTVDWIAHLLEGHGKDKKKSSPEKRIEAKKGKK